MLNRTLKMCGFGIFYTIWTIADSHERERKNLPHQNKHADTS